MTSIDQEPLFTEREMYEAQTPEQLVKSEAELAAVIQRAMGNIALIRDVLDGYGYQPKPIDGVTDIRKGKQ